jgi:hypothetical protein
VRQLNILRSVCLAAYDRNWRAIYFGTPFAQSATTKEQKEMAQNRQAGNLAVGLYESCAVRYHRHDEGDLGLEVWEEGATVRVEEKWVRVTFRSGVEKRFLRSTNRSLQIYPGATVEQARNERQQNASIGQCENAGTVRTLNLPPRPPSPKNLEQIRVWDDQYYDRMNLRESRGWTDGQIRGLLGPPDALDTENPYLLPLQRKLRTGSRLYLRTRVESIEAEPGWVPGRPHARRT